MTGRSTTSSMSSSHAFSVSRVPSNGNGGVLSSVIWLVLATALCFPWLVEKPAASKAADTERSLAWFAILGLDLILGTTGVFSLWFRKSTLSIMLLIWGSCAIVATFLVGSFAMLPAVATMCCCAPELCLVSAADITALDNNFCYIPLELCMETRWRLWCFYGGILLTMVSIVLLVNSVGLHHKTLLLCERELKEAARAARAAYRARRHQQELWEREVYGYAAPSARTLRSSISPGGLVHEDAATPRRGSGTGAGGAGGGGRDPLVVVPSRCSPSLSPPRSPAASVASVRAAGMVTPSAPALESARGGEMQLCRTPTSAPPSSNGRDDGGGVFAFGAATARRIGREGMEADGRRIEKWGGKGGGEDVVMSWVCDDEEEGAGRTTPKTALRFKTSALARVVHK